MKVNLLDVIDAIDTVSEDETYFYSIQDEEIVYALDDGEDDEFFVPLPTKEEVNDYQNMVNFTETIEMIKNVIGLRMQSMAKVLLDAFVLH